MAASFARGEIILGYRILKQYGEGGMSQVFLAENLDSSSKSLNKYAVVKIIKKEDVTSNTTNTNPDEMAKAIKNANDQWKKAIDEFQITWSIFENPHENIVKPIKWDSTDEMVIIVSEFIDGPSLNKFIEKNMALTIDRALFYFRKICEGVRHFHKLNDKSIVIHRDLKPENIILTKDYREIKIIDYGIATSFYDNHFSSSEGTIYCTADYTTPDVLQLKPKLVNDAINGDDASIKKMKKIISVQFDFHALGVILYYMITGNLPFNYNKEKVNDLAIIKMWNEYDLPIISNSISNVPNSIENIIFRCVASKPEDLKYRYNNIDELISDFETWDNVERKNEPLLKPIEKRKFQQTPYFNVANEKMNEKFYEKWWFWACVSVAIIFIIVAMVIALVVVLIG